MVMSELSRAKVPAANRRYVRDPVPVHFPEEECVPETGLHLELRTLLYLLIQNEFGDRVMVGSEQFVYWDPTDPRACLAPDVMVWVGAPDDVFATWKVWERGAPHVAVEIASRSDQPEPDFAIKLERYRRSGVRELVRYDPEAKGQSLRLWDRVDGDLVERVLSGPESFACDTLNAFWCLVPDPKLGRALRLAHDPAGTDLLLTRAESEAKAREREAEAHRLEAEAHRLEAEARQRAEARVRELEAELAKRNS
jgi:Putative restriction endonuclease